MSRKRGLGVDVLSAARERISWIMDRCPRVYVSYSGGKDSTVLLDLAVAEATRRRRKIGVLFVDLEAQYRLTIDHVAADMTRHAEHIDAHWLALPLILRNAVSQFDPRWTCWDPAARASWVREPHEMSVTDGSRYPWFRSGMEFEELTPAFARWYAGDQATACLVGIRADESLNRFRTLMADKTKLQGEPWTTWVGGNTYNAYPIYDWKTQDIWTYHARTGAPYNGVYDRMHLAGVPIHNMRICQPYGDDQRRGLYLYHVMEPETWGRVVARVNGANQGALYAHETGMMLGRLRIDRPPGHTWESYARFLLGSMPPKSREHFDNKIATFLRWWEDRGYPRGIPDEAETASEAARDTPSWRRIVKTIIKNDYWCKGLSFSQTKSEAYDKYMKAMKNRRARWGT